MNPYELTISDLSPFGNGNLGLCKDSDEVVQVFSVIELFIKYSYSCLRFFGMLQRRPNNKVTSQNSGCGLAGGGCLF